MATIKDLTGTIWGHKETLLALPQASFYVSGKTEGYRAQSFTSLLWKSDGSADESGLYVNNTYSGSQLYASAFESWLFDTIEITGGMEVKNAELIEWFSANFELISAPAPTDVVTIEYNGSVIASLKAGQTATLTCKDKPMHTDVVVSVPNEMGGGGGADSPLPIEIATEAEMTVLLRSGEVGGVYKYTGTTGTYENGALYVLEEGASLITFTIAGDHYQAEDGMTWDEWVESEYNTRPFYNSWLGITTEATAGEVVTGVEPNDTIISGHSYSMHESNEPV